MRNNEPQLDPVPRARTHRWPARVFMARVDLLLLIAVLLYLLYRTIFPIWRPLVWAVLVGALLAPTTARLSARLGGKPRLAAGLVTVLTILLILLPMAVLTGAVAAQSALLLSQLQGQMPTIEVVQRPNLSAYPRLQECFDYLGSYTGVTVAQLQTWLLNAAETLLQRIMASGGSMVLSALGSVVSFLVMMFVLFFVLRDGPRIGAQFMRMLPIEPGRRDRLMHHLIEVTQAVFLGTVSTAVLQGLLLGIGYGIAGLPAPLVFAVLSALVSVLPVGGTLFVFGPGALWLAVQGDYGHAVLLAAWGTAVAAVIDIFVRPVLMSGRSELPTLAAFIGVMGGLSAFGFIGLFLGPIVLGLLVALFRFECERLDATHTGR